MNLKSLLALITICLSTASYAQDSLQNSFQKKIVSPYESYYDQERERVYLHLNRSEYLAGDNLWFKAYVFEAKSKLPMEATNKLYVELFDQKGKLIERKILFVSNGVSDSYFKLSEKLTTGAYTIRSYTNWMRNFNDLYTHEFKVLSPGTSPVAATHRADQTEKADLQVFPEGGMFVEGINNHFGVKVTLPNGKGTAARGYVLGPSNDTLQSFTTNHLGFGDFTINAAQKAQYRVGIKYDVSKEIETVIPEPVENGIGLIVNTLSPTKVIIAINSNPKTIAMLREQSILIMIHNNGIVFKSSYLKVKESGFVSIAKSLLDPGVNYVTIFGPGFQPMAERLIFNTAKNIKGDIDIDHSLQRDTLQVNFATKDLKSVPVAASLSVSVLPANTVGNNFSNSLHSEILLTGIIGNIEDPIYYTESNDLQHQKDMDNLLLTQGWRGYKWPEILSGKGPDLKFPFESGFTINTTSKNLLKGKPEKNSKLSLFSPQNSLVLTSEVNEQGKASFDDLYLRDSSHVIISSKNLKGSGSNRNLIASIVQPSLDSTITRLKTTAAIVTSGDLNQPLIAGPIELKEVLITGKKMENPFASSIYSSGGDQFYVITKENYNQYTSLESLLQSRFFLRVTRGQFGELSVDMGRGQRSILGSNSPSLILDGSLMPDLSMLSMIAISDVEAISINKTGIGLSNGGSGSINIITRKRPLDLGDAEYKSTRTIHVNGYAKPATFYTPKYILSPGSETYQRFASIFWKADLTSDSTGSAHIKFGVPNELTDFIIRIEGIAPDGTVFYSNKRVNTATRL